MMCQQRHDNRAYKWLVSCPDSTLSRGKRSGDHWAISWLCRVSSLDTEQSNEIALRHATMCSTDRPICCRAEIEDEQICICPKTAKEFQPATTRYSSHMTNGILLTPHNQEVTQWSPDPFSRERVGSGHETRSPGPFSRERVGSGHETNTWHGTQHVQSLLHNW